MDKDCTPPDEHVPIEEKYTVDLLVSRNILLKNPFDNR